MLVICSSLDLNNGAPTTGPINVSWLADLFESVLTDRGSSPLRVERYGSISISWKRVISEMLANATSLSIALFIEGFDWPVPVAMCKEHNKKIFPFWPTSLVPGTWKIASKNSKILLPDYVMAKNTGAGFGFSVLEAKGRDKPIHTEKYPDYCKFKAQSLNARLIDMNGNPGPGFQREILSMISIRPQLRKPNSRKIQCRWTNANREADSLPEGWLSVLAARHYIVMLDRMFGNISLPGKDHPLSLGLLPAPRRGKRKTAKHSVLEEFEDGYSLLDDKSKKSHLRPFISKEAVELILLLREYLGGEIPAREMDEYVQMLIGSSQIFPAQRGRLLSSGIGIIRV